MFTNIRKRDGRIVEFDSLKITSAIAKAAKVTGEFGKGEAEKLTTKVLKLTHESCPDPIPDVEEIQDIVEKVLFNSPNLTRKDGSGFERQYAGATKKESNPDGHNFGHNGQNSDYSEGIPALNTNDFIWSGRLNLNLLKTCIFHKLNLIPCRKQAYFFAQDFDEIFHDPGRCPPDDVTMITVDGAFIQDPIIFHRVVLVGLGVLGKNPKGHLDQSPDLQRIDLE